MFLLHQFSPFVTVLGVQYVIITVGSFSVEVSFVIMSIQLHVSNYLLLR